MVRWVVGKFGITTTMKIRLHKNRESLEAENRWWSSLSDSEKQAEINRRNKEDDREDAFRMAVGCLFMIVVVVVPMILGIWEICKMAFKK